MASNQAKARSTFQLKRSLPEGGVQTSCATHGEKRSLDAVSESQTPQFRKDLLTRCDGCLGLGKVPVISTLCNRLLIYMTYSCYFRYARKGS